MTLRRSRLTTLAGGAALLVAIAAATPAAAADTGGVTPGGVTPGGVTPGGSDPPAATDPCTGTFREAYLCPDLTMAKPYDLYITRTAGGRTLLRAGNSIQNRGRGPAELNGTRIGVSTVMTARQRIYKAAGGSITRRTGARIVWKRVPGQDHYWKWENAARFDLWSLDSAGRRVRIVRSSPKLIYCLRDYLHPNPGLPRSPRGTVYPACSQEFTIRRRTLGTSVGWSDDYPSSYFEQWIDITGLRAGRYSYVMTADPESSLSESDESNNQSWCTVTLPITQSGFLPICGHRKTGSPPADRFGENGY